MTDIPALAKQILSGQRRALARAITLVESTRPDHRRAALELLDTLKQSSPHEALRIGLSGTPGVGKSTFTEAFGMMLIEQSLRVAVLAVDPSSARSGGSILGDKTRMERLSRAPNAFIRPSPSQTALGGVARRTREAIALCEAATFDVILIETVGVGQSETLVADMSDVFVLLLAPAGGDELQGVKRGIMEIADMILINKADGDLKAAATRTAADYAGALRLLRKQDRNPEGFPLARTVSALTGAGLSEAWQDIQTLADWRADTGVWQTTRAEQARFWFQKELRDALFRHLSQHPASAGEVQRLEDKVMTGEISPSRAADLALERLTGGK